MPDSAVKTKRIRGVLMPRLKEIRESKGLSRPDLAIHAKLNHTFIWRIEERGNGVGHNSANQIAAALGVPREVLTGEKDTGRGFAS